jgi:hypothetical protein
MTMPWFTVTVVADDDGLMEEKDSEFYLRTEADTAEQALRDAANLFRNED